VLSHSLSRVGNEKTIFMIYNLVASARKPLIKDPPDFLYQFSLCQTQFPNLSLCTRCKKITLHMTGWLLLGVGVLRFSNFSKSMLLLEMGFVTQVL
jgi:hypothetical protein